MKPKIWLLTAMTVAVLADACYGAAPKVISMTLHQAEAKSLAYSNSLKSSKADWLATQYQAQSQYANLLPRLTLDGSYRYVGVVPSLNVIPGESFALGAYNNYSVGPTLTYTLWDGGANRDMYHSLQSLSESRKADHRLAAQQILMNARMAYVKVQLALEELHLIAGTLKVSQAQYSDISKKFLAGSASRLDRLSSHRETLSYLLQFKQRQTDLASGLEDLVALTGDQDNMSPADAGAPCDEEVLSEGATGIPHPTLLVYFDPLMESFKNMVNMPTQEPGPDHPQLQSDEFQAQASALSAESAKSQLWPVLQLSARTSLDYPNGPILEQINQNIVGVTLSMPLWEWDRTRSTVGQHRSEAVAAQFHLAQSQLDLRRDWRKGVEQIKALQEQLDVSSQAVVEAQEHAKLSYQTYRYGRISLLDVQNSNLLSLQAQVQRARIVAQILIQKVQLLSLSGKEFADE